MTASVRVTEAAVACPGWTSGFCQRRRGAGLSDRAITIIVPAAAGGPTDTVARLMGESMGRTLGQQIVVENVGGAGGTIGMARVAKAAPDGYTLAVWHIAQARRRRSTTTCSTT